jgi:hypothetical protein
LNVTELRRPILLQIPSFLSGIFCRFFANGFDERKQVEKFEESGKVFTRKNSPSEPENP